MKRRMFLRSAVSTMVLAEAPAADLAAEQKATAQTSEPLVWPVIGGRQTGIRSFAGHANTVLDTVRRSQPG